MSDENKLSRRGFLGAIAAIGTAPIVLYKAPEVEPALFVDGVEIPPVEDIANPPPVRNFGPQMAMLEYNITGEWVTAGEVHEATLNRVRGGDEISVHMYQDPIYPHLHHGLQLLPGEEAEIKWRLVDPHRYDGSPVLWEFSGILTSVVYHHRNGATNEIEAEIRVVGNPLHYVGHEGLS